MPDRAKKFKAIMRRPTVPLAFIAAGLVLSSLILVLASHDENANNLVAVIGDVLLLLVDGCLILVGLIWLLVLGIAKGLALSKHRKPSYDRQKIDAILASFIIAVLSIFFVIDIINNPAEFIADMLFYIPVTAFLLFILKK